CPNRWHFAVQISFAQNLIWTAVVCNLRPIFNRPGERNSPAGNRPAPKVWPDFVQAPEGRVGNPARIAPMAAPISDRMSVLAEALSSFKRRRSVLYTELAVLALA